jgi:hypothetical protein
MTLIYNKDHDTYVWGDTFRGACKHVKELA